MKRVVDITIIGIFFSSSLFSQTDVFHSFLGTAADSNKASLRFDKNIYTYFWNFNGAVAHQDSLVEFYLTDQFTSSLIRRDFRSIRDENSFAMNLSHTLSGQLSLTGEAQSFVLSDNQSLGVSNAAIHSALAGISYRPTQTMYITPLLGIRYDKQQDESNSGLNVRLHAGGDSLEFGGYRASFLGELNQSDLNPRKFTNNLARINIATDFGEGSKDSVRVHWLNNRWDF
ncbi:MAG: hypothetical protein PHP42_11965, partial [Bacteroidota bacterium]|nr:hypothetical protein [Bacteroidota bacterium]